MKLVFMCKNTSSILTAVSALRRPAVAGTRCYVSGIQKLANSIELRSRSPGDQTAGDTVNYLQLINTPATRNYHRQISLRSRSTFQTAKQVSLYRTWRHANQKQVPGTDNTSRLLPALLYVLPRKLVVFDTGILVEITFPNDKILWDGWHRPETNWNGY